MLKPEKAKLTYSRVSSVMIACLQTGLWTIVPENDRFPEIGLEKASTLTCLTRFWTPCRQLCLGLLVGAELEGRCFSPCTIITGPLLAEITLVMLSPLLLI